MLNISHEKYTYSRLVLNATGVANERQVFRVPPSPVAYYQSSHSNIPTRSAWLKTYSIQTYIQITMTLNPIDIGHAVLSHKRSY